MTLPAPFALTAKPEGPVSRSTRLALTIEPPTGDELLVFDPYCFGTGGPYRQVISLSGVVVAYLPVFAAPAAADGTISFELWHAPGLVSSPCTRTAQVRREATGTYDPAFAVRPGLGPAQFEAAQTRSFDLTLTD